MRSFMMRKGQVTIFIILGIVVAVLLISFFIVRDKLQIQKADQAFNEAAQNSGPDKVVLFVDLCFDEAISKSLQQIMVSGGYSKKPTLTLNVLNMNISYYLYNGEVLIPNFEIVEKNTNDRIIENYKLCINDFKVFGESDFVITAQEPTLESKYEYNFIDFKLSHKMKIETEGVVYDRDYFSKTRNSKFKNAYDSAKRIVDIQRKLPAGQISVYDVFNETITNDFEPNFVSFYPEGTVFILDSIETGELFAFAIK